jgi:LuxR family transcriptional regulator, maltose regulon positive regulatory protein
MLSAILATKLYIPPPPPKVVLRPRLIERLNEALCQGQRSGQKLTLISAPAGFGKTTLLSEWIVDCEQPVAWLSLDEGDRDPTRFLVYFVAALQKIAKNIGEEVLEVLQSPQPPPIELILTTLINDIAAFGSAAALGDAAAVPNNFILVLDDYHVIDSKPVDEMLTFLLERLPLQMHLVIITREDPNLPLARLRARGQLTELRAADLRFSLAEAAGFLNQMMGQNVSAEYIAALETRTEGWIAGLKLAALAMRAMPDHADTTSLIQSFTGTHYFVMDYLIEEVLQQQSERVQTFLLRTAILDRLCGPLCDAVLLDPSTPEQETAVQGTGVQGTGGQMTLEYIEHANLFIIPLDNERHWYRYHHLFADLLRQRLGQSQTPEAIAQYHIRASEWFEQNGDQAEAFHHLIAARDFSRAAGLAERCWQRMNDFYQSAAWLDWVKQLPEALICSRPVLCTQIAWGLMDFGEVDVSEKRLKDAEQCLENSPDEIVIVDKEKFRILPAMIAFVRCYNAQTQRDFISAMKFAELVFKLLPEENHFLRAQTAAVLGATYWANGNLEKACKSLSDWIDNALKVGNFVYSIAGASGKADILTAQGHLREAVSTLQKSLQLASMHEREAQRVTAQNYLGLGMLHHEMGEDEYATWNVQKSLVLGDQFIRADWPYRKNLAQARLKESAGELETAIDLLDEAKRFYIKTLIPDTRPIDAMKARIYLKQGQLSKAVKWVNEQGLSVDDELSYLREYEHISLARVLLAEYQRNRDERVILAALRLLDRLMQAAEAGKRMGSVLEILITQALVYQAQSSTSQAIASLKRALTLAQPEGYVRVFVDEGDPIRTMLLDLRKASEKQASGSDDELKEYVDKLLSAFEQPSDASRPHILQSKPVDPLSQRELEILRLIAMGLSNRDISERLFIALSSVKGHNQMIFSKLHVQSRTEAVARARELRLL